MNNKNRKTDKKLPFFTVPVRTLILCLVTVICIAVLSAFNYLNLRNKRDVKSVDSLSGQRIGCCVGWESDYLLSERDDITLLRYNTNADCILALNYGQVDAIGVDAITAISILQRTDGLEVLPEPIASIGCTLYASYEAEPIMEEFNEFVAAFRQTEDYTEYKRRTFQEDGNAYRMAEIPKIENGKKLRVGFIADSYPESFYDFETQAPAGYGIEILERFAYAYGYTIEYIQASDTSANVLLQQNKIDFSASYISDVYRKDTESGDVCHMTDSYLMTDVYLIKVADGKKLQLKGTIDN